MRPAAGWKPHLPLCLPCGAALITVRVGEIKGFRGRCQGPGAASPPCASRMPGRAASIGPAPASQRACLGSAPRPRGFLPQPSPTQGTDKGLCSDRRVVELGPSEGKRPALCALGFGGHWHLPGSQAQGGPDPCCAGGGGHGGAPGPARFRCSHWATCTHSWGPARSQPPARETPRGRPRCFCPRGPTLGTGWGTDEEGNTSTPGRKRKR